MVRKELWIKEYEKRLKMFSDDNIEQMLSHPITLGIVPEVPQDRMRYRLIEKEAKRRGID